MRTSERRARARAARQEGRRPLIALGLGLTLMIAALGVLKPAPMAIGELRVYDTMLASRTVPAAPGGPVVLVGIDDPSLAAYGQWPWPRYRLAMLLERLFDAGASAVALDFLMPEPDRSAPEMIDAERRRDLAGASLPESVRATDSNSRRLADAMARGPTVLGYFVEHGGPSGPAHGRPAPPKLPDGMIVKRSTEVRIADTGAAPLLRSLPVLTGAARAEGFTNAQRDLDGTIRRIPLLLAIDDAERPALAFAALLAASPDRMLTLAREDSGTVLKWSGRRIPLDPQGNLLLDFRAGQHPYVSARSVLEGTAPADRFAGRIVLVGASARGLGDLHLTPSGRMIDGLDIHATVVDDILAGTLIERPGWAPAVEIAALLLAGAVATVLLAGASSVTSLVTIIAASAIVYAGARHLLAAQDLFLSPLLPILALILIPGLGSLAKYGIEVRKVRQRTRELLAAQDAVILGMSTLASARDRETGGHIRRTQRYVDILARQLATMPAYAHLTPADIELLAKSAPLHDIGKVGVPDSVLQKPGKLTDEEFAVMKSHTTIGAEALGKVVEDAPSPGERGFLHYACEMAAAHHERWDGRGYPRGLAGDAIPLAGRLMAVADVYDALVSARVYKKGFTPEEARRAIVENAGSQFDPDVVAAFVAKEPAFVEVARRFADQPQEPPQQG